MGKSKGKIIHELIKGTGMSVAEWAKAHSFSQTTVNAWINEDRNPKYKSAQKLAKSLGVRVEDISEYKPSNSSSDEIEDRVSWVSSLSYDVYAEIVNALEDGRLDPFDIAKVEDIEDFQNRAIIEVSKLDIPADVKGKVVALLSSLELVKTNIERKNK